MDHRLVAEVSVGVADLGALFCGLHSVVEHAERRGRVEGNGFTGQITFKLLACDPLFTNQNIGPSVQGMSQALCQMLRK